MIVICKLRVEVIFNVIEPMMMMSKFIVCAFISFFSLTRSPFCFDFEREKKVTDFLTECAWLGFFFSLASLYIYKMSERDSESVEKCGFRVSRPIANINVENFFLSLAYTTFFFFL